MSDEIVNGRAKRNFAEITDPKRDETIEAIKQGFSPKEVAMLVGTSIHRVYQLRYQMGVSRKLNNVRRWLKANKVKAPWVRVEGVRAKNGLVLCFRSRNGAPAPQPKPAVDTRQRQFQFDMVNRPPHYTKGGLEVIDFIEAKGLGYNLGNVIKYVSRVDGKDDPIENLRKAEWYLKREIAKRQGNHHVDDSDLPMFLRKQAE